MIYLLNDRGTLYWGTFMRSSPNHLLEAVWRKEPVKLNHWYITSQEAIYVERLSGQYKGEWLYCISGCVKAADGSYEKQRYCVIRQKDLSYLMFDKYGYWNLERKKIWINDTKNAILNRIKEYKDCSVVPSTKCHFRFLSRWKNAETHNERSAI